MIHHRPSLLSTSNENGKVEALSFLTQFSPRSLPKVSLRDDCVGPNERVYLITDFDDNTFKVYAVETLGGLDQENENIRQAILPVLPAGEYYVTLARGFSLDLEGTEITVGLGEEWLFKICVDEETETYMIERNNDFRRDTDISPMIRAVGKVFRETLSA